MNEEELQEIRIKKVLGPTQTGTAVLLGDDEKTFVMFIGIYEGAAIVRELNEEVPARPLTHELMAAMLDGFNVEVKRVVISDIIDNTFCATLVLEQPCVDEAGEWNGRRNEVHIDARPSDCLVIALKSRRRLYATRAVLSQVRDIAEDVNYSALLEGQEEPGADPKKGPFGLKGFDVTGLDDDDDPFDTFGNDE
jgi:uncharacterized protein